MDSPFAVIAACCREREVWRLRVIVEHNGGMPRFSILTDEDLIPNVVFCPFCGTPFAIEASRK